MIHKATLQIAECAASSYEVKKENLSLNSKCAFEPECILICIHNNFANNLNKFVDEFDKDDIIYIYQQKKFLL